MATILIVDDDPYVVTFLFDALRGAGHIVDAVGSGEDAVNKCVDCRYAMVISDIHMPDVNGAELLEMIRAQRPGMPFIYMTGDAEPPAWVKVWKAEAIIRKGDGIGVLLRKVGEVLSRKGTNAGTSQLQTAV